MAEPPLLLLDEVRRALRFEKDLADRALAQLRPEDWHARLDPEANSIAIIVRHLHGNMQSRWTQFLSADGEKAWRDRDGEFEASAATPHALLAVWEQGWATVFDAVDTLTAEDLDRTITIRGEPHSVARALLRQVTHYAEHVGQIVLLAKHWRGASWRTLSIPRSPRSSDVPLP